MVAKNSSTEFITLDVPENEADAFRPVINREAGSFYLIGCGLQFVPMYTAHHFPYHTYFKINKV